MELFGGSILTSVVVMLAAAGGQLLEDHNLSLGTIASVGAIVLAGTWHLSRQFQKIDDRLTLLENTTKRLYCQKQLVDDCDNPVRKKAKHE